MYVPFWPPRARKTAETARFGPSAGKTELMSATPAKFQSFYSLELFGLIHKRPGHDPFFCQKPVFFPLTNSACAEARRLDKFWFLNRIKMINCIKYLKQSVSPNNLWIYEFIKIRSYNFYMNWEQLVSNSEIWANKILFGPAGLTGEILIQFYAWFMGQHSKFISTSVSQFCDWMCFSNQTI